MFFEFKNYNFLKGHFIFSTLLFFICFQTLIFNDGFSSNTSEIDFGSAISKNNFTNDFKTNFATKSDENNNTLVVSQNQITNDEQIIKIIAAGDFGCRSVAENNIEQIELQEPDIFLVLGDLSYGPSMDCWYDMTEKLDSKIKIAIGNHEDEEEKAKGGSKELKESLLEHYNLPNSYYSFDYENVHVLILDTQLEFSLNAFKILTGEEKKYYKEQYEDEIKNEPNTKYYETTLREQLDRYNITGEIPPYHLIDEEVMVKDVPRQNEQYEFAVKDLEKANNNSSIDWIIVAFHKPMYSSLSSHIQEYIMREKYQPIFDKYNVDIVLQGHTHFYDRTLPLKFNPSEIEKPIISVNGTNNSTTNTFVDPEGTIFSVVGTGGRSGHVFLNQPDHVVKQHNEFGFLSIEIKGNELDAKYYDIGYKCKKNKLKESDLEKEGDFKIFDMSSCKIDRDLAIIDQYKIIK